MITPHRTDAAILHLKQLQTKEEVVHMLQARIHQDVMIKGIPFMPPGFLNLPDPAFTSAINKKNGFTTLNRADFVTALICLFKGAPPKPNEEIHPALRTLIEYVNGVFDQQAFVTGSSAWRIKQGARTSTFNATTVLQAYTVQNTAVYVDSGLFKGKKFPTKAECSTLFKLLTWGKKTALKETEVPLWIYHNLGSSSFFNDLFSAAEFFLRPDALITTCPSCEQLPCMALNVPFPPLLDRLHDRRGTRSSSVEQALRGLQKVPPKIRQSPRPSRRLFGPGYPLLSPRGRNRWIFAKVYSTHRGTAGCR